MRYAMIMAGGSGTRLWPMSRAALPKQLIPFIHGKSLLEIAVDRLAGLVPPEQIYICAGEGHQQAIFKGIEGFTPDRFLGEPTGRDTLNAVGFSAAAIAKTDPDAVIAVFTADHVIEPVDRFQRIVSQGYALAESDDPTLVTFGIAPTHAATGYGYLQLGSAITGHPAFVVDKFQEKPDEPTAQQYHKAGPDHYLWNSGMFVWKAATLLDCIKRYEPTVHTGLTRIADAWGSDQQSAVLHEVYPELKKISIDYAVMQPASADPQVRVAAVPMALTWLDVGSWPAFAETCPKDEHDNALGTPKHLLLDSQNNLVASSDPDHLIATIGCEDLIIIHTPDATLVCPADRAQDIKKLHEQIGQQFGKQWL